MRFTITIVDDYIRADLYERRTAEETRQFLQAFANQTLPQRVSKALIATRASRPIFNVGKFSLSAFLDFLGARPGHRVALVADTWQVQLAQRYMAALARLRGLRVRSFSREAEALDWLKAADKAHSGSPVAPPDERGPGPRRSPPARRLRVLVVDDDRESAATLVALLRNDGHDVRAAYSGGSALMVANHFRPEAIFVAIRLADISGREVARQLRADGSHPAPLLIGLGSPGTRAADESLARAAGFAHYVAKPYDPLALLALLDPLAAREASAD